MKSKIVWIAGVAGLAVLSAAGLHLVLPEVEKDVRAQVTKALALNSMEDVKANVSGQTVTLTAMDADPDAQQKLQAAKGAIASIADPDEPKVPGGGQWLNGTVTRIDTVPPAAPNVANTAKLAGDTAPGSAAPVVIEGEKATSIDTSVSKTPPVAGDEPPLSRVAAQACEEKIYKALRGRKVSYEVGTYTLSAESQPVLDDVYATMVSCPGNLSLTVVAYTDNAGDAMAARLISRARAQAAADSLIQRGFSPARLKVKGEGQSRPIAANTTPEGREANRRVAFEVNEQN